MAWIYNILEKRAEKEQILYDCEEEDGFLIIADYSFRPGSEVNLLHLIALPYQRNIRSIRDLN
jgi:m7GpppX diphosphatase